METYISGPHDTADLLHRVKIGAQAAMHGENLLVDDSGDRKTIEAIGECFPQLNIISAFAFIVEAVDAVDRGAFVVTSQNEEVLGILDLVGQQETNCFE